MNNAAERTTAEILAASLADSEKAIATNDRGVMAIEWNRLIGLTDLVLKSDRAALRTAEDMIRRLSRTLQG